MKTQKYKPCIENTLVTHEIDGEKLYEVCIDIDYIKLYTNIYYVNSYINRRIESYIPFEVWDVSKDEMLMNGFVKIDLSTNSMKLSNGFYKEIIGPAYRVSQTIPYKDLEDSKDKEKNV